ncbi:hypothetical protein DFH29DRAFT_880013 [Suillus ampliporus]|nr:hypothetical protein DFH29DRAFT_880013 [Suillus ampliporus]
MSFPENKPDSVLAEVTPISQPLTTTIDVENDQVKWRQICGFIEVTLEFKDGPNTSSNTTVKTIVSQGVNYARLIMTARPFQLPAAYDARDFLSTRTRQDSSFEGHSYYQSEYPSLLVLNMALWVQMVIRIWKIVGAPIWSSLSLYIASGRQEVVLKTVWRSQTGQSEPDVYRHIKSPFPGVAELSVGDDVRIRETNAGITVWQAAFSRF